MAAHRSEFLYDAVGLQMEQRQSVCQSPADKISLFNKLVGSDAWWTALSRDGAKVDVEDSWPTGTSAPGLPTAIPTLLLYAE